MVDLSACFDSWLISFAVLFRLPKNKAVNSEIILRLSTLISVLLELILSIRDGRMNFIILKSFKYNKFITKKFKNHPLKQ